MAVRTDSRPGVDIAYGARAHFPQGDLLRPQPSEASPLQQRASSPSARATVARAAFIPVPCRPATAQAQREPCRPALSLARPITRTRVAADSCASSASPAGEAAVSCIYCPVFFSPILPCPVHCLLRNSRRRSFLLKSTRYTRYVLGSRLGAQKALLDTRHLYPCLFAPLTLAPPSADRLLALIRRPTPRIPPSLIHPANSIATRDCTPTSLKDDRLTDHKHARLRRVQQHRLLPLQAHQDHQDRLRQLSVRR